MRIALVTLLCACILALYGYWVIEKAAPEISASIASDVLYQLKQRHIDSVKVSVDGRDVTLYGDIQNQEQINQAMKIASHRPGVRIVMNNMVVIENSELD